MAAKTKEKETVVVKTQEEMYLDAERLLKATECLTRDKEKAEFFKNLADRYKDLGEYEDSKDKYEECLKKHKYYKEQSKIVKEIQPKEEDFNENKSKSNGIIGKVIIGLVIVLVIAAAGGIVYLKTKPGRYQRATFYENKGNYEKSYKMFKNLKNYKDSKERKRDCKYQFALQCWKDEDYEPAIKMFRELVESEYGDSEEKLADLEIEYIKKQKIGTNVIFGNFHWLILENDGDKVLLVKSEPINGLAYNEGNEATTWSECTLREYLNGSFLDGTFSLNMQKKILDTNIKGTAVMMDACRKYGIKRYHQVSTDEVYGDLPLDRPDLFFTEETPIHTSSPYSSSKAAADLLVLAYHRTYGLPVTISRCSNNYGPYHFPEKLIPLMIANALADKPLPVYGEGLNVRDWLYVEDHCRAIDLIIRNGRVGEVYNVGGHNEMKNIDIVKIICKELGKPESLITYVTDRKGHDMRYAIDPTKIHNELGWLPETKFEDGIKKTIQWYLDNKEWWKTIISGEYQNYYKEMYENR